MGELSDYALAGAQVITGVIDAGINGAFAQKNYELQKDAYEYQKQLNALNYDYTRNKYKYTKQDLLNSGLSPLLMANGSPSNANVLQAGQAPQFNYKSDLMSIGESVSNIALQNSQNELNREQSQLVSKQVFTEVKRALLVEAETLLAKSKTGLTDAQKKHVMSQIRDLNYNFSFSKEHNIRTVDDLNNIYSTFNAAAGGIDSQILDYLIDISTFIIPGAAAFKGAKFAPKALPFLKEVIHKGKSWTIKNWNALLRKFGIRKGELPPPSDFF